MSIVDEWSLCGRYCGGKLIIADLLITYDTCRQAQLQEINLFAQMDELLLVEVPGETYGWEPTLLVVLGKTAATVST